MYENLPLYLKAHGAFCGYRFIERNGKKSKIPFDLLTGSHARSNDRSCFCGFETALQHASCYDGLGVGVFDDLVGIDIDDCIQSDGALSSLAQDVIETMDSYTEVSPSGKGIRIFARAEVLAFDKSMYYVNNRRVKLEVYVAGHTSKFLTVTGNTIRSIDVCTRPAELMEVLERYMKRPGTQKDVKMPERQSYLSDETVVSKLLTGKQAERMGRLWKGDTSDYESHSEADMALLSKLVFWCSGDTEQMDRLFRQSGLMREKWDRAQSGSTYGRLSVEKAICLVQDFYVPSYRTSARDDFAPTSALAALQPDTNERYTWTDIGAGRLFADCFQSEARYVPERKAWYVYHNGIWSADIGNLQIMELCKQLADQLMLYALSIQDERQRNAYIDYCRKWQQRRYRETILKDAQSVYPITMDEFDRDPYLFNCKNGTLHLNTLEFTPHCAEDHLTKQSPVIYDPTAHNDRFITFVEQIMSGDAEKGRFLQKALGYGLSGDTRFECLFILYGATTRNGKGTLCESVLQVLGSYGCTSRPETIAIRNTAGGGNPTEDIARLAGVRFANISEPYKGLVLNASQVKSMTGNDTLNARFLHENSFDFRPQFKLYINTNYLPTVNDMTLFSSGRIVIIPFDRHFDDAEQDKSLKQEFAKTECQSAILNWLVHGYQMLRKEGMSQPTSVQEALSLYRRESDKIAQFMVDELVETPDGEERTSAVYSRYRSWCVDNGHHSENMRNFKQALSAVATVVRRRPRTGGGETTLLTGYTLTSEFL